MQSTLLFRVAKLGSPAASAICARQFLTINGSRSILPLAATTPFIPPSKSPVSFGLPHVPSLVLHRTARTAAQRGHRRYGDEKESTRYDGWGNSGNEYNESGGNRNYNSNGDDGNGNGGGSGGGGGGGGRNTQNDAKKGKSGILSFMGSVLKWVLLSSGAVVWIYLVAESYIQAAFPSTADWEVRWSPPLRSVRMWSASFRRS